MNKEEFVEAVSNLVKEWATKPNELGEMLPRPQLEDIYHQVREQAVYDLAEAVRLGNNPMRVHGITCIQSNYQ
jgi:hypothetical protein